MDGINNNYTRAFTITIVNKSIILSEKDKEELAKYAEAEKPYESCAILVGNETDQKAKESNMEIVCIFHSHPESEAQPSETDKKFMRVNPFPWIIYSGKTKEMNCFILQDENVKQISII